MGLFVLFCLLSTIPMTQYISLCTAQSLPLYVYHFCLGDNYTTNGTFQSNLNFLLSSLISTSNNNSVIKHGYHNVTVGQSPDTIYGSLQCRGDVTSEACQTCVKTATQEIVRNDRCPNSKQAIIWYDECMFRYSNQSFFSIRQEYPRVYIWNDNFVTNPNQFNEKLGPLMDDLIRKAVSNTSNASLFAAGKTTFTNIQIIYGLVQCTQDISLSDCNWCLRGSIAEFPRCCDGRQGGRVIRPSCNVRYDKYPFFESRVTAEPPPSSLLLPPPPMPSRTNNTSTATSKGKKSPKLSVIIVVALVAALSTIAIWCICFRRKKAKKKIDDNEEIQSLETFQLNFTTISVATNNFSVVNKLGEGGFGAVYKGILPNGKEIAVKRLSRNSCQGEQEFKNEVVLVAKLQHRNLAGLLGFCLDQEEKLLIYEFMPNGSLDQFIFDSMRCTYLDWERRYKIIRGIARGLQYLHEDSQLKIIHRDLKASNILLSADMNPKISDFGMARLFLVDQTQANTNRIVGTFGYMAPEYAMHGHFSVKSDVFSFGVLILEILSGKKNNSFYESVIGGAQDLLSYAWRHWKNGTALELVDPTFRESCSRSEVMRCIHIGLLCVQEDITDRPTMTSVILMLNSYSVSLALPSPPAYYFGSRNERTIHFGECETQRNQSTESWTVNKASVSELSPR